MSNPTTITASTQLTVPSLTTFHYSRNVAIAGSSLCVALIATILIGISFLPSTTLPFSGGFFIIGSFVMFIAMIIIISLIVLHTTHLINHKSQYHRIPISK